MMNNEYEINNLIKNKREEDTLNLYEQFTKKCI